MAGLSDRNFNRMRKRVYWNTLELGSLITAAHTENETFDEGKILTNVTDETVHQQELGGLAIVGINICEGPTDDGNFFHGWRRVPYDLDPKFPVGFRVNWSQASAVTDGTTFVMQTGVDKKDAAFQAITAYTALDTILAESNAGGASYNQWTTRGIRTAIGLTRSEIEDGAILRMEVEADVVDTGQDKVTILGIEMDYVQQTCQGIGSESDRPLTSS